MDEINQMKLLLCSKQTGQLAIRSACGDTPADTFYFSTHGIVRMTDMWKHCFGLLMKEYQYIKVIFKTPKNLEGVHQMVNTSIVINTMAS